MSLASDVFRSLQMVIVLGFGLIYMQRFTRLLYEWFPDMSYRRNGSTFLLHAIKRIWWSLKLTMTLNYSL